MPKVNEMYPSKWLAAADLEEQDCIMTIRRIQSEDIGDGEKWVLYFDEGTKGLVLNKTNGANANNISSRSSCIPPGWTSKASRWRPSGYGPRRSSRARSLRPAGRSRRPPARANRPRP